MIRSWLAICVAGFLIIASAGLFAMRLVEGSIAALALGILWVSALPLFIHLIQKNPSATPFLPAIGGFYGLFFALPVFLIGFRWDSASEILMYWRAPLAAIRPEIVALVLFGIGGLIGGFYLARYFLFARVPALTFPRVVGGPRLRVLYWMLLVGHLAYLYWPALHGVPSLGQILVPVGTLAFAGFYLEWRRGRLARWQTALVILLFLTLKLYASVQQLFLTDFILLMGFILFVLWREKRFSLVVIPMVLATIVLLSFSAVTAVRNAAPPGLDRMAGAATELVRLFQTGETREQLHVGDQARFGALVHRTAHIWVFHIVADKSPDTVPYWNGVTYKPIMTAMVPRVLYPDKPEERTGGEFGRRYGFLTENQTATSVNLPWITELLANFGPLGVLIGMPFFGMMLGFLDRTLNASSMSDAEFLVGLTIIFPLAYQESNFSVTAGSLPLLLIALSAYFIMGAYILKWLKQTFGGRPG